MRNKRVIMFLGMVLAFVAVIMMIPAAYADDFALTEENIVLQENCTVAYDGNKLTVTDTEENNDVWSSKLLLNAGLELTVGEQYQVSFELAGETGVGEFFLCKSENLDDRYDETFASEEGNRSITFTAADTKVYIGLQVGNLGNGNSMTATVSGIIKQSEAEYPELLRTENCTISMQDGVLTATDDNDNNDVWNSKLLYVPNIDVKPGKTYSLRFELSGENGVGEFFVCKSANLNDRFDSTFVNREGTKTVTFRANSDKIYIGMQFGNLGKGNSVSMTVSEVKEYKQPEKPAQTGGEVLVAENTTYEVETKNEETVIEATDTSDNNDVWNSKILYYMGDILETGRYYAANFNLSGENGVGEFFFCKKDNLDDRYSFDNIAGDHTAKFTAEDEKLYAGMQFGNIGEGNDVTATIYDVFQVPGLQTSSENCYENLSRDGIMITDTSDNSDVWNSKAVYNTGMELEQGRTYTATFTLSGENGVGEFFFLKSANTDDRYTFDNAAGEHTVTFVADGTDLYFGFQCGNIGNGNNVMLSNVSINKVEE